MLYTIEIKQPNEPPRNVGVFSEEVSKPILKIKKEKYPNGVTSLVPIRAVVSCWHCGEPIIITNEQQARRLCQMIDQLTCSDRCEKLRRGEQS